jgi:hypothetical protein
MLAAKQKEKIGIDVELLVRWAYVDELSKRQSSAAEGIWDHILDYANHGGIDSGRGAAQRYAHFGLPDPDAERVERVVSSLADIVIDWDVQFDEIAGDLAGLISVNDLSGRRETCRAPKAGWGAKGSRALKAFYGDKGASAPHDRPRDVLMVAGLKTAALVVMHAIKGTRPDWGSEPPRPEMVPATRGSGPTIVGERGGRNLYTIGSYCPLTWWPSPLSVVAGRADYFAWHQGLTRLSETLCLDRFEVLPPKAPRTPWIENCEETSHVIPVMPNGRNNVSEWGTLPLKPLRPRAGPPFRRENDPGRVFGGLRWDGESLT